MCDRLSSDRQMTRTRKLWSSGCCNKDAWDPFPSNHYGSGRDKNLQKAEDWSPLERRNFNPHPQWFRYDALALSSLIRISNNSLNRFALSMKGFSFVTIVTNQKGMKIFREKNSNPFLSWEALWSVVASIVYQDFEIFFTWKKMMQWDEPAKCSMCKIF